MQLGFIILTNKGDNQMSKKLVSKTLIALSILTVSGTLVNTLSSVEAHPIMKEDKNESLKEHYSKWPLNITGIVTSVESDGVIVEHGTTYDKKKVKVVTKNRYEVGDRVYVFTIGGEEQTVYYGITKNKQEEQHDLITVNLEIKTKDGATHRFDRFKIAKGETTMKEYDFRLRHLLVDKFGLYGTVNDGDISIQFNKGGSSNIKLDNKFPQNEGMDVVVNSSDLDKVIVTLN